MHGNSLIIHVEPLSRSSLYLLKNQVKYFCFLTLAITVSIKPASSSIPLVKQIGLYFDGDVPMPGKVECLSDPSPAKVHILNQA